MTSNDMRDGQPHVWQDYKPGQVRVMLLGTYHMDNPGLDSINIAADDVLTDQRQTELCDLVDCLADWNPDRIAVERPYHRSKEVNKRYKEYRSEERKYDQEETFPAPHPMRDESDTECRSEVVQIGFRLADQLAHDHILSIDEHPEESQYDSDPFENREIDSKRKTTVILKDPDTVKSEADERLIASTIPEYFAWINTEDRLRINHDLMFDQTIRATDSQFGNPIALTYWYDRNIRIVHHLWRSMGSEDEQILLLIGSGHIRVLRHLLTEAPMFCPLSPLPYLPAVG